VPLNSN